MSNKQKTVQYLTLILIALIAVPVLCFSLGAGRGVSSGWTTSPRISGDEYLGESVIVMPEGEVSSLYVYVGDIYFAPEGKLEFTVDWSNSASIKESDGYISYQRKNLTVDSKDGNFYGWILLDGQFNVSAKYVKLTSAQAFNFTEVAFADKDGNAVKAECYGGVVFVNGVRSFVSAQEDGGRTFTRVCDEQSAFSTGGSPDMLTQMESELMAAANNLLSGTGYYVSQSANPLAVELLALGVSVFGNNSFGLRIIPFLFAIATVYLCYFLAKKIFGSVYYGAAGAAAFLLCGMGLSLATNSSAVSIALFFVVAAYYFAYGAYATQLTAKNRLKYVRSTVLSAIMVALALSCELTSLVAFPGVLALCVIPAVKGVRAAKSAYNGADGLEREYAREKYLAVSRSSIAVLALSFILAPALLLILSYCLGYASYTGYYATNVFDAIIKNTARRLQSRQDLIFVTFLAGFGSQTLPATVGADGYIIANKAAVLLSTLSMAACTILYLLKRLGKISNVDLLYSLDQSKSAFTLIAIAFASNLLLMAVGLGKNDYATFAYSLVFLCLALLLLYKIFKGNLSRGLFNSLTAVAVIAIVLFFVLQSPCFLNFTMPEKIAAYYLWLL